MPRKRVVSNSALNEILEIAKQHKKAVSENYHKSTRNCIPTDLA
ncbi:hypothetical protein [Anaerotignum sp.]|nr:hypothetical protein [Anaerotignum sp.]